MSASWDVEPGGSCFVRAVGAGTGRRGRARRRQRHRHFDRSLGSAAPATIVGIDPTPAQVAHAAEHVDDRRVRFEMADARTLPFADASFDVVAAGLVLNFVPEPWAAVMEMRRAVRPSGIVAAYVWDFEPELSPSGPLRAALKAEGIRVPALPGTKASTLAGLANLCDRAGFANITTRTIEITVTFANFSEFWASQTARYSPTTKIIDALDPGSGNAWSPG